MLPTVEITESAGEIWKFAEGSTSDGIPDRVAEISKLTNTMHEYDTATLKQVELEALYYLVRGN